MSIEINLILKVSEFIYRINSDGDCPRVAKSAFSSAKYILSNIDYEADKKGAVQRALTQLELAYQLVKNQNGKFFAKSYYTLQNELCYNIALFHKALGNSSSLIREWMIDNSDEIGDYDFADKDEFIKLVGKSEYGRLQKKIDYNFNFEMYKDEPPGVRY